MSDTPRTVEESMQILKAQLNKQGFSSNPVRTSDLFTLHHALAEMKRARALERELNAANTRIAILESDLKIINEAADEADKMWAEKCYQAEADKRRMDFIEQNVIQAVWSLTHATEITRSMVDRLMRVTIKEESK